MYSYVYDETTGGILLTSQESFLSKEPRPVYAAELDLLGFSSFWSYDKQNDVPYMWAEANNYFYRNRKVASLKGGSLYEKPEIILFNDEEGNVVLPETEGEKLKPIDIKLMVKKNKEKLCILEQSAVKSIQASYNKFRERLDCFHVAFSGGKDSLVLLDLVKKALPKQSYIVLFGDTGMEFPDTYATVDVVEKQCQKEGVAFYRASSHLTPNESWDIFAPPSRVLRWCCSVHKSTPQTLLLRQITGKNDYTGLDYVGVRGQESARRSTYSVENYGKKQKGQYSHNSILEWTSAEVWLYIFSNDLIVNEAYKKGNSRAGCLFCPMTNGANDYIRRQCYPNEMDLFINKVRNRYSCDQRKKKQIDTYLTCGGWNARKNGRELTNNPFRCIEISGKEELKIEVVSPTSDWTEWIKTLGEVSSVDGTNMNLLSDGEILPFTINIRENGYTVKVSQEPFVKKPALGKLFKQVFRKASYCVGCRVCESNCKYGNIRFIKDGRLRIDQCCHCHECHNIDSGCLLFHSLRHPQGGGEPMKKSLNSYADHAPKTEWFEDFFALKDDFFTQHTLGPMMYDCFRRFLREAGLQDKNQLTPFAEIISKRGWNTTECLGLMLVNLVSASPQIEWYVKNLEIGRVYPRSVVEGMLVDLGTKEKDAKSIVKAFKRIVETPFGTVLSFGSFGKNKENKTENIIRTKCTISNNLVVLYALYKFAEKCGDYKKFTLDDLFDNEVERNGVSPAQLLGIEEEEMKRILIGLSARYPDFIHATFTHDLEKISLADDKTSVNVLGLFE